MPVEELYNSEIFRGSLEETTPSRVGIDLVRMWSFCLWQIIGEPNNLDPVLRDGMVESYFWFLFALGWRPSEVLYLNGQKVNNLNHWRDMLLKEIKERLRSPKQGHLEVIKNVLAHLDYGKPFIADGYSWLETVLTKQFLPNPVARQRDRH